MSKIKSGCDLSIIRNWLNGLLLTQPQGSPSDPQQEFLAGQTWDSLRLNRYFVVPVREPGGGVETILTQCKHASRGRL